MVAFLTKEEIQRAAPSVYAEEPSKLLSDRYNFVSTADLLAQFDDLGYGVTEAKQANSYKRSPYNKKHMVRLRRYEATEADLITDPRGGTAFPEILLINSSDGSSSLRMAAGLFACVCSNGLVVQTVDMGAYRTRHVALDRDALLMATRDIDFSIARTAEKVEAMGGVRLNALQRMAVANAGITARWGENSGIVAPEILVPRREEDRKDDLWTVFNVAQENLVRGGFRSEARPRAIRELTDIDAVHRVNLALWGAAESVLVAA